MKQDRFCDIDKIIPRDRAFTPSPGTPGEGWGEGLCKTRSSDSSIPAEPSPRPLPAYRERVKCNQMRFSTVIVCLFTCCLTARAADRYYVSPTGDDHNDGKSESIPLAHRCKSERDEICPRRPDPFSTRRRMARAAHRKLRWRRHHSDHLRRLRRRPRRQTDVLGQRHYSANCVLIDRQFYLHIPRERLPTSQAYYIFANHEFLHWSLDHANLPAHSFCISDGVAYVNTGGSDPRSDGVVYTASDRAAGTNGDSSLICSNGHNNLVFKNLIGRETAAALFGCRRAGRVRLPHPGEQQCAR